MKVILCGYNWIGCKTLQILINEGHDVYVYTHDNPPHINSLIEYCHKLGIDYTTDRIEKPNLPFIPDLICSIYYRYIIHENIIDLVGRRIFNLHPSLLPKYKGCSSLTWAMINGESKAGFTYHYLDTKIDGGNILIQKEIDIEEWDTQVTLYHRVMFEASELFMTVINKVMNNDQGTPQLEHGNYFKRGCPFNGKIDPNWTEDKTERFIRAMNYPPLPYAQYKGKVVRNLSDLRVIKDNL